MNARLGTNWSMHDLHTAALRMSRDRNLTLRDVQVILGHQDIDTTVSTYLVEEDVEVARRLLVHLADRPERPPEPPWLAATGYDPADLAVLLGRAAR